MSFPPAYLHSIRVGIVRFLALATPFMPLTPECLAFRDTICMRQKDI